MEKQKENLTDSAAMELSPVLVAGVGSAVKTLHLTLKKKWFDMILSGEKKEEYREIKHYWERRLLHVDLDKERPFVFCDNEILYDVIEFRNGYGKNAPTMIVSYQGVDIGNTKEGWADEYKTTVFVLKLGKILETKNV